MFRPLAKTFFAALLALLAASCASPSGDPASADESPAEESQAGRLQSQSYALYGKQAPDFTLPRLEGGTVTLSQHFGKDIVILDFWATWCSPCRRVMPLLEETAAKYGSQGVVLYSVNWGEDAQTIRDYLEDTGLKADVLMDEDIRVGPAYQVRGLPATVLLDREGTVRAFMTGLIAVQERLDPALRELTGQAAGSSSGTR
ncbi:MAG TPA: TlpA disulfide reductase family protein [Acidobacteriota bacterium]|nr:TlpA disulfide reductase family protein [Acidobacteriota bacterium]